MSVINPASSTPLYSSSAQPNSTSATAAGTHTSSPSSPTIVSNAPPFTLPSSESSAKTDAKVPQTTPAIDPAVERNLESRVDELSRREQQLATHIPTYHGESVSYMKRFVRDHFGIDIDPDKTYLNEYEPINEEVPSKAGAKFPPTKKEIGVGRLIRSTPLSQIAYSDLYQAISQDTKRFHISTNNNPQQSAADEKDVIDPHNFYDSLHDLDFKSYYSDKVDAFYKTYGGEMRNIAQLRAMLDIDSQHAVGDLDDKSYDLAKRAFNPDSNDKDPPKVYPFEVSGYQSNDGLLIVGKDRTLAYLRGEDHPITILDNPTGLLKNYGYGYPFDPNNLESFAAKHFSQNDANGRSDGSGVMAAIGPDTRSSWAALKHSIRNWSNDPFSADKEIHQDPFGSLVTINQRHDKEDANFDITSNADVNEKKIIRLTAYIPLPFVSGVAGMFLGKTKSQWDAGALSSTFDAVSLGVAKFHPTLSFITDYGLPVTQIASMGQSDPGPANPANPGDPNDPDDPNNPDNTQIHWQNYGVNNWNKSW